MASSWPSLGSAAASTTIANQTARGAFVAGAMTSNAIMGTELDLMAKPKIRLHFRVNQGVSSAGVNTTKGMSLASTTISSGNTCPVRVAAIAWGAVVNALEPTIDGTYMSFTTSRLYVPVTHLKNPQAIISTPVKKVRFNDCYGYLFYQRAGIGKQSTQLNASFYIQLSASVKNAKYVILLPFAEQTNSLNSAAVQVFQSPFDSAPWTLHPGSSIRNFNVRIVSKISAINGGLTPELVNGLLGYQSWSLTNRVLIADVSRLTERGVPQSIQIQGFNAGCEGVNMIVLVMSEQELTYDRLTGEVLDFLQLL
ncbi:uncharacterized protein PITG_13221 [Phytophthora infestans T30-4]|uniref:Uncharacterized protein n=1 Tax=Phytophthora infestans (strain T30-4) TaxID=403677 RepID=D0NLG6_PHYIT|nr:uncharacterized protein PITG_13221 [Phytophthora infestans T30-4]EEY60513.1 conserved hypothetical protein [Phytophthora infestans T30-4]|eukprot:XP_002899886.1 conserved hypothetical protein [Phytophthora infestans T30-4]